MLAGFWGTGAGASTLTENVHTIAVTKMGSRRPVEFGACILILLSVVGKELHFFSLTLHKILPGKDENISI
jgi:nucleobase transporter 1/2